MRQFNLEEWLKDKSRKVVTRSGHNVRILCTDQRGNMPIVALVEFETLDGVQMFYSDGKNESHREYDLFFADEKKEELTEFDYAVLSIISDHNSHTDSIEAFAKRSSKKLLAMARKEMMKDAVELTITNTNFIPIPKLDIKCGDKAMIIIMKED